VNVLEKDVVPTTHDSWMLAALHSLAGNHEQFLTQAKMLIDSGDEEAADLLTFISHANESSVAARAKIMALDASNTLAMSVDAKGMPLAALERLADNAQGVDVLTKCRLAVGAILSEELFRDVPDAEFQIFTRAPWNLNLAMMQTLLKRRSDIFNAKGFDCFQAKPREPKSPSNVVHENSARTVWTRFEKHGFAVGQDQSRTKRVQQTADDSREDDVQASKTRGFNGWS
jgi:hypothetical protein